MVFPDVTSSGALHSASKRVEEGEHKHNNNERYGKRKDNSKEGSRLDEKARDTDTDMF